jgi:hypothetical protein
MLLFCPGRTSLNIIDTVLCTTSSRTFVHPCISWRRENRFAVIKQQLRYSHGLASHLRSSIRLPLQPGRLRCSSHVRLVKCTRRMVSGRQSRRTHQRQQVFVRESRSKRKVMGAHGRSDDDGITGKCIDLHDYRTTYWCKGNGVMMIDDKHR